MFWPAFVGAMGLALFSGGKTAVDVGSTGGDMLSAEACAACHPKEYEDWAGSRHRKAWDNSLFQYDYSRTRRAWCKNCHMPLEAQRRDGADSLRSEGVNCAVCHVRDGKMVARRRGPRFPHRTVVVESFGSAEYCAGCHEFRFPVLGDGGEFLRETAEPMQATVTQFRQWAGKVSIGAKDCLACHRSGAGGHRFPGAHDREMLRRALSFELCRDMGAVVATVTNVGAGHNVPTGDVHRHIVGRVWRPNAPERLLELFLGRRFALAGSGEKTTTWDSTLRPGQSKEWRTEVAQLGGSGRIFLEFLYLYGASERPRADLDDPASRVLFRANVAPGGLAPCTN